MLFISGFVCVLCTSYTLRCFAVAAEYDSLYQPDSGEISVAGQRRARFLKYTRI